MIAADQPVSNSVAQAQDPGFNSEPSVSPHPGCGCLDVSWLREGGVTLFSKLTGWV